MANLKDNPWGAPLCTASWPRAILHIDADAFFASCEQSMHPHLRGKPVVTGRERGICAAASYEAKGFGVERGMRIFEILQVCPEAVIVPSDYESYSLFSLRMFEILRRFSPSVEEYSIDEAFADLDGLRRKHHGSYRDIAWRAQQAIWKELKLPVTVGVAPTKVLAKIASKYAKPFGVTAIPGREIHEYLYPIPAGKVWGIGPNTANHLMKLGVRSALNFARKPEGWVREHFTKPQLEIWHELNGRSVLPIDTEGKSDYQSISKTKTFTPPSSDHDFVFAQLAHNCENACRKARRHLLASRRVVMYLKAQSFQSCAVELRLSRATAFPTDIVPALHQGMAHVFVAGESYRATGIVLNDLKAVGEIQPGLFDDAVRVEKISALHEAVDTVAARWGKNTVALGASLPAKQQAQHEGERGDIPWRKTALVLGETKRQRLGLIRLDVEV